jgi:hypothetical protein
MNFSGEERRGESEHRSCAPPGLGSESHTDSLSDDDGHPVLDDGDEMPQLVDDVKSCPGLESESDICIDDEDDGYQVLDDGDECLS